MSAIYGSDLSKNANARETSGGFLRTHGSFVIEKGKKSEPGLQFTNVSASVSLSLCLSTVYGQDSVVFFSMN